MERTAVRLRKFVWLPPSGYHACVPVHLEEKRAEYVQTLERALRTVVERLSALPEVEKVVLFGSYLRGRRDLLTDLDLLVVVRSAKDPLTRTVRLRSLVAAGLGVDMDLFVYTPEEVAAYGRQGFLRYVLAEGKVIYERAR